MIPLPWLHAGACKRGAGLHWFGAGFRLVIDGRVGEMLLPRSWAACGPWQAALLRSITGRPAHPMALS